MLFDDGLDTVELIMLVEDTFSISIPDRDAERIYTAGGLSDYVAKALNAVHGNSESLDYCPSALAFFTTRQRLSAACGIDRRTIRPNTPVDALLPYHGRRAAWRDLGQVLNAPLPPMELSPRWLTVPFCVVAVGLAVGLTLHSAMAIIICCFAGFPISLIALGIAERGFGSRVPQRFQTVGKISTLLLGAVVDARRSNRQAWSEPEVWHVIRQLVARCADLPSSDIKKETRLLFLS